MRQIALTVINLVFDIIYLLLIVRAFITYLPHNRQHPLIRPIFDLTEPMLSTIRRGLPPSRIGADASPFIAIVLFYLLQQVILYFMDLV